MDVPSERNRVSVKRRARAQELIVLIPLSRSASLAALFPLGDQVNMSNQLQNIHWPPLAYH